MTKCFVSSLLIWALSAMRADAQMLSGRISDPALRQQVSVVYNPDRGGSRFDGYSQTLETDGEGRFTFDTDRITEQPFCMAYLKYGDRTTALILQPGKSLTVDITGQGAAFSGDNAQESAFLDTYNQGYDYDVVFPMPVDTNGLTNLQKREMLETVYAKTSKSLMTVKDQQKHDFLQQLNEDAHRNFLLRLVEKGSDEERQLMDGIDVNNWIGLYNYLPQRVIGAAINPDLANYGHDMTDYGLDFLRVMRELVTDPTVKHYMLGYFGNVVLNYGKDYEDIDRFWHPFCDYAAEDSAVVRRFQAKVDAIRRNRPGQPAPDITFSDPEGKSHRLSEFYGQVLYIDLWATWCGPCCKEIPYLEKQVEAYKDNSKVRFISISIDTNQAAWRKKLEADAPQWAQFIVSREENKALSAAYGVTSIPRFLIIHSNGTIADADAFRPSDEHFRKKLDAIIIDDI